MGIGVAETGKRSVCPRFFLLSQLVEQVGGDVQVAVVAGA